MVMFFAVIIQHSKFGTILFPIEFGKRYSWLLLKFECTNEKHMEESSTADHHLKMLTDARYRRQLYFICRMCC